MERQLLLYLSVGVLALGGCGGDPGEAGPQGGDGDEGAACSVTTAEDKATIVCPDGSETILEASSCTVESDRGVHTIRCPGAEPVVLSDGDQIRNGSINGTAIRYGLPPIAGIDVEIVGPSGEQVRPRTTNEEGVFQLTAVPAGLHRVRLQAPGYQPLEIPNVLVLGGAVDLGEQTLMKGRLLAAGLVEPRLAPNEEWAAIIHADPFGGGGGGFGVTVISLSDDRVHWLGDELVEFEFISDRYAMIMRDWSPDLADLSLFDLERGELIEVGPVSTFDLLAGGLLAVVPDGGGLALRFIALPGGETYELGAGTVPFFDDSWDPSRRFIRVLRDGVPLPALWLFDSAEPDQPLLPLSSPSSARDPESGVLAFVQIGESGDEIRVFDPATDAVEVLGAYPTGARLRWSHGGAHLAASTDTEILVFDRVTGEETPWNSPASRGVEFSPSGKLLVVRDTSGTLIGDWSTGASVTLSSDFATFSATERWAAACIYGTVQIIDTEDLSTQTRPLPCEDLYFIGEILFVTSYDQAVRIDPATGAEQLFEVYTAHVPNPKGISIDTSSGEISIVDMLTGETIPTGFEDSDWIWSENPDYLLVVTGPRDELHLLDLRDGASLPIDKHLEDLDVGERGFVYMGGASPLLFPAATSGGGGLFDGIKTYWVPFQ